MRRETGNRETGDRRQELGDRKQEKVDRRHETGYKKNRRKETRERSLH